MHIQFFTAHVWEGTIVPDDDVELPEGTRVTVLATSPEPEDELTEAEEREWLESLVEAGREELLTAEELLPRPPHGRWGQPGPEG